MSNAWATAAVYLAPENIRHITESGICDGTYALLDDEGAAAVAFHITEHVCFDAGGCGRERMS